MARLWENGENGTGENGTIIPFFSRVLRFFSRFPTISHIFSTFPTMYFWQFLTIPPFPPFSPILPHFSIFPFFQDPAARRLIWLRLTRMPAQVRPLQSGNPPGGGGWVGGSDAKTKVCVPIFVPNFKPRIFPPADSFSDVGGLAAPQMNQEGGWGVRNQRPAEGMHVIFPQGFIGRTKPPHTPHTPHPTPYTPSRAPSLCPATVSVTASASPNSTVAFATGSNRSQLLW